MDGSTGEQTGPLASQPAYDGIANIDGPIACGKHFAGLFDFGRYSLLVHLLDDVLRRQSAQRGKQYAAIFAEGFRNFSAIAVVGNIATCPPRHENLHASLIILLENQDFSASCGSRSGGPQPSCTTAYNNDVPTRLHE